MRFLSFHILISFLVAINTKGYSQQNYDEVLLVNKTLNIDSSFIDSLSLNDVRNGVRVKSIRNQFYGYKLNEVIVPDINDDCKFYWSINSNIKRKRKNGRIVTKRSGMYISLDSIRRRKTDINRIVSESANRCGTIPSLKSFSGNIILYGNPMEYNNMVVSPYKLVLKVRRGKICNFLKARSESISNQGILWQNSSITFDATCAQHFETSMKMFANDINGIKKNDVIIEPFKTSIKLTIQENDSVIIDEIDYNVKNENSLKILSDLINQLPKNYFPKLYNLKGYVISEFVLEAGYDNEKWSFSVKKFVK